MSPVVMLRAVESADLPVLFEQQLDPEAARLAAFPSRAHDAFMAHWAKVLANPANAALTIVHDGRVAGHIGAWTDADTSERLVGYWIGRTYWGRGIASVALGQFLSRELTRPLTACVARHNIASVRVLQKNGFTLAVEDRVAGPHDQPVDEWIFRLE